MKNTKDDSALFANVLELGMKHANNGLKIPYMYFQLFGFPSLNHSIAGFSLLSRVALLFADEIQSKYSF
tara:strand:- start:1488 stop:1694 length:207 start_codon:yes stop_codon:yes gene_type:complete